MRKRCFGGKRGLEGINSVNRGRWRDNSVRLSEAITVSVLINSTPNPSGASLLYSVIENSLNKFQHKLFSKKKNAFVCILNNVQSIFCHVNYL
jgi:hypothetical protein